MTSKEALIRLYIMADTPEQAIGLGECYDIVEKDLEVLEILKESITYKEEHKYMLKEDMKGEKFMIFQHTIKGTEKVDKIKEWLHNENNKG